MIRAPDKRREMTTTSGACGMEIMFAGDDAGRCADYDYNFHTEYVSRARSCTLCALGAYIRAAKWECAADKQFFFVRAARLIADRLVFAFLHATSPKLCLLIVKCVAIKRVIISVGAI
jgi:hypothetical protein